MPRGLIAEEHTTYILEIPAKARDWRVLFSEERLRESHLWSHIGDIQRGILVPPFRLSLKVVLFRCVIHLIYDEFFEPTNFGKIDTCRGGNEGIQDPYHQGD